jgi:uncharacterized membrane protein YqgA involved in biofilm formation
MKIINDTLKKSDGKWDKQALTFFVSFVISCTLGVTMVIVSYALNLPENKTADNVFNSFMILTGALSGTNIANKLADKRNLTKEERDHGI